MRPGDSVEVTVEKGIYRGLGLGRVEGRALFVARGLPGDRVRARVTGVEAGFARATIEGHASYIDGQLPFLNYAAAANDNLDLGSGAVEAACKTLVTQRLKISGAKWSRPGARAILYLRSLVQSGRLDNALDFHHARRLKRAACSGGELHPR